MELNEYLNILKKNVLLIAVVVIIVTVASVMYASKTSTGYKITQTYLISQENAQTQTLPPQNSQITQNYDSFYQQEKARNFTDTAVAVLQSSDFQQDKLSQGESILVQKLAPQVIKITSLSPVPAQARALNEKIVNDFNQKNKAWDKNQTLTLRPISNTPEGYFNTRDAKLIILFGLVSGLALAIFTVGLKTYLKL